MTTPAQPPATTPGSDGTPAEGLLSELMESVRLQGNAWSSAQSVGAPPDVIARAWRSSSDPFAMLLLLAALHPQHDEPLCDALVAGMAFFEPMRREQVQQSRSRPGMTYNGPDRFRCLHLAQRVRAGLEPLTAAERAGMGARLASAIRGVVPSPDALAVTPQPDPPTPRSR